MSKYPFISIPEIVWFQEGPGVRNAQYKDSGIKLLNVANLQDGQIDLSTSERYISKKEAYGRYKHFLVDDGDFIIASSGIKVEYFDKKMGFANKFHLPLCMNTSTIRFKPIDKTKINMRYFMYSLKTNSFKEQLRKQITGSAQLNFGPSHLKKMRVPLAPLPEQERIARELDTVFGILLKQKEQEKLLNELIKSKFNEMFGDPNIDLDIGTILLGECTTIVGGSTPKTNIPEYWAGDLCWVTPAEINEHNFIICDTERKITQEGAKSCSLTKMPIGTVLFSSRAPIGKVAITGVEMYCNQGFKNFICDSKKILPYYLYFLLKYNTKQLNEKGSGATFKELSKSKVEQIKIKTPPLPLQQQFADFVNQVEESKEKLKAEMEQTETLYRALMQKYFGE